MNSTFHNNSTVKLHIVYVIKITEIFLQCHGKLQRSYSYINFKIIKSHNPTVKVMTPLIQTKQATTPKVNNDPKPIIGFDLKFAINFRIFTSQPTVLNESSLDNVNGHKLKPIAYILQVK